MSMVEAEAPVRRPPFGGGLIGRLALIDRRKTAAEQDLAAKVELLWRFVAGIDSSSRLQTPELAFVELEPVRLSHYAVRLQAEPVEVVANRRVELRRRALAVGVIDPEDELALVPPREQEVVDRGADVADVKPACGRGSEAGDDSHHRPASRSLRSRLGAHQSTFSR